ncbi:hypothetical protein BDV38DRAFT_292647 [Aspergillus pseudotamarii]|uniref:Short chain oxidoreductase n=1 Tax=Aspergillus pseudotamarii TaxID=132259 RepID=A0A5N6SV01_ASPPS|nr:uncharacterized protein BDV38DRAFT_292647 [Aspergillus pseudotamarii]KAE8137727.1 hypothetical protein BDV38DRAFT_292647 [Aspergillus pseudotamarii]
MASYLITGSSRGLGLALVSQLLSLPASQVASIFATSRSAQPSPNLKELIDQSSGRASYVQLDVTDTISIRTAARQIERQLQGRGLDVLINNAGIQPVTKGGAEYMDNLSDAFNINVNAPHEVTRTFLPLLRKGERKVITNISTTLGSISKASPFMAQSTPAYNITKAALNMLTVQYALSLESEGFTVFCVSPGWLKTDLGGPRADLPVQTGAEAVLKIILEANHKDTNGKFLNIHVPGWEQTQGFNQYDGAEIPW